MEQTLSREIFEYVIQRLPKSTNNQNSSSNRVGPHQNRSIRNSKYQMDELSKKILRGIKSFFRKKFGKQLRGKADRARLEEYESMLITYFDKKLNCQLQLQRLFNEQPKEYNMIIWIFFPLPIQRIISKSKSINIEKPEIFQQGYKGKLNEFFTSGSQIGRLIFRQLFEIWSYYIRESEVEGVMRRKYEVYLRDIQTVLNNFQDELRRQERVFLEQEEKKGQMVGEDEDEEVKQEEIVFANESTENTRASFSDNYINAFQSRPQFALSEQLCSCHGYETPPPPLCRFAEDFSLDDEEEYNFFRMNSDDYYQQ